MNRTLTSRGFTLVELLVAVTLIATLISMVYGSYVSVADTSRAYTQRVGALQQGHMVLHQIQSLLQGCFTPEEQSAGQDALMAVRAAATKDERPAYFQGDGRHGANLKLRFVTSRAMAAEPDLTSGRLYHTTLAYDASRRTLTLRQTPIRPRQEAIGRQASALPLATEVEAFSLSYYDGKQWHPHWHDQAQGRLPVALAIELVIAGRQAGTYRSKTVVYLPCTRDRPRPNRAGGGA